MKNILRALCLSLLLGSTALATAPDGLAASSCCRPQCAIDRDCDRICGKGLGTCRLVNSCCKECLCLAV